MGKTKWCGLNKGTLPIKYLNHQFNVNGLQSCKQVDTEHSKDKR